MHLTWPTVFTNRNCSSTQHKCNMHFMHRERSTPVRLQQTGRGHELQRCYKQQSWAVLLCVGPPAHPAACEGAAADGGEAAKDWQDRHSKLSGKVNQVNRRGSSGHELSRSKPAACLAPAQPLLLRRQLQPISAKRCLPLCFSCRSS